MSKGYWLTESNISNMPQHEKYTAANRAVLARYGARLPVRWGRHKVVEGTARERQIVIEFPDYESAIACYHDPEYEAAHELRIGATTGDVVVVVEGYDGPAAGNGGGGPS